MQFYTNSKRIPIKTFLLFFVTLLIAFLPASSFLFFIKNDAFNGYFPSKFFISESLQSGYLPLWNPYINYGLPQYGDMNSGFWSPITWLIALTIGYNAYSFTIELLTYLLLSGIGMFLLSRSLGLIKEVAIIAGVGYMCSGYMVGHLQHFNWISGAAFLPFAIWSYYHMLHSFSIKNIVKASLFFYLFIASAHPGLIIGAIYFFALFFVYIFYRNRPNTSFAKYTVIYLGKNIALVVALLLLSLGLIAGYTEILPHITRGVKLNEAMVAELPVSFQSLISAILPLSIAKNDAFFETELTMRNIYFGLPLLLFFLLSIFSKKTCFQKFLLLTGIGFLIISLGGFLNHLPLFGYVRLKGEFTIFFILTFILTGAFALNKFLISNELFKPRLQLLYTSLKTIFIIAILYGIIKIINTQDSIINNVGNINLVQGINLKLKFLIDELSFYDTLIIQSLIQLILLGFIKLSFSKKDIGLLLKISIIDLVLATLLNVPFTGTGKASVKDVQTVLAKSPKGIIIPPLSLTQGDTISEFETGLVGDWSFYNKTINLEKKAFYPVELNNTKLIFEDTIGRMQNKPFLFCTTGTYCDNLSISRYAGSSITFSLNGHFQDTIVLKQNYYPHWNVIQNGQKKEPIIYSGVFPAIPITPGNNKIIFQFNPALIKSAMIISAVTLAVYLLYLLVLYIKQIYSSRQPK